MLCQTTLLLPIEEKEGSQFLVRILHKKVILTQEMSNQKWLSAGGGGGGVHLACLLSETFFYGKTFEERQPSEGNSEKEEEDDEVKRGSRPGQIRFPNLKLRPIIKRAFCCLQRLLYSF